MGKPTPRRIPESQLFSKPKHLDSGTVHGMTTRRVPKMRQVKATSRPRSVKSGC